MLGSLFSHGGRARCLALSSGLLALLGSSGAARAGDTPVTPAEEKAPSARSGEGSPGSAASSPAGDAPRAGEALLLRTAILGRDPPETARASDSDSPAAARAQQLDLVLSDAIQDLGFTLDLSEGTTRDGRPSTDLEVIALAAQQTHWVIYPSVDPRGSELIVRIVAVAPSSKVASIRTEPVKPSELAVRAVVMLRDLVVARTGTSSSELAPKRTDRQETPNNFVVPARSQGRATLAFNGALFGGFVGYSVQRGTGSDNLRLLFPMMALGTGLGLGASAIVAEEWDVGLGDAWFLSAATWWPAFSGLLLARSRELPDPSTEYGFAVIGAVSGLGLATTALALRGGMSEGGALLTHSGGAFGTFLGGMTEFLVRGQSEGKAPFRGAGYGAGIGVAVAGALATQFDIEPSRVLAIDLGAGLGGLVGAAVTSPFIFHKDRTEAGDRAFVISTMGATVAGGVGAWLWTRKEPILRASSGFIAPYVGIIAESALASGARAPVLGVGVTGVMP